MADVAHTAVATVALVAGAGSGPLIGGTPGYIIELLAFDTSNDAFSAGRVQLTDGGSGAVLWDRYAPATDAEKRVADDRARLRTIVRTVNDGAALNVVVSGMGAATEFLANLRWRYVRVVPT